MSGINLAEQFSKYQTEDQLQALPAGSYTLEVTSAKVTKNGNGVMPVFKVATGPDAGKKVMAGSFVFTDNSRAIFYRNMAGFGLGQDFFATAPSFQDIANSLIGRVVTVDLIIEPWNGEDRNKIPIGRIKLESAPAPGAAAGVPVAAAAAPAPIVQTAPVPAAAPAPVAPPIAEAAPAAPAPVAPAPVAPVVAATPPPVAAPPVAAAPPGPVAPF